MPLVHWRRAKGFAGSLAHFGGKLKVAGPTFAPVVGHHAPCTTAEAIAEIGQNASAYEGSEIFDDPPDFIFCGATDTETEIHALFARLNDIHPVALCAYSGNHYSRFDWSRYDGAICTDRATHAAARHNRVPSVLFRPAFSFDDFPYREQPPTDHLILRSYIQLFQTRFPVGFGLFQKAVARYAAPEWPDVLIENVEEQPLAVVAERMTESAATLHLKDREGFGWSILESMAVGRPVILQTGLVRQMAMEGWALGNRSALFFDDFDGLDRIVARLRSDRAYLRELQISSAATVRALYDPVQSASAGELAELLAALAALARRRWSRRGESRRAILADVAPLPPTLDRNVAPETALLESEFQGEALIVPGASLQTGGRYRADGSIAVASPRKGRIICSGPGVTIVPGTYDVAFVFARDADPRLECTVAGGRATKNAPAAVLGLRRDLAGEESIIRGTFTWPHEPDWRLSLQVRALDDLESEVVLKRVELRRRTVPVIAAADAASPSEEIALDPEQIPAAAWIPGRAHGLPF